MIESQKVDINNIRKILVASVIHRTPHLTALTRRSVVWWKLMEGWALNSWYFESNKEKGKSFYYFLFSKTIVAQGNDRRAVRIAHRGIQLDNFQSWKIDPDTSMKVAKDNLSSEIFVWLPIHLSCVRPQQKVYLTQKSLLYPNGRE